MREFAIKHVAPLGVALGLLAGASDYVILLGLGVEMRAGGRDVTLLVCSLFAASSAGLGFFIGQLYTASRRLKAQSSTIAVQLDELKATQARAVRNETLAAVGTMAAGVAHEVRNPLAVIRSSAELLGERVGDESGASAFIVDEVDRLDRFVTELLDLGRPFEPELRVTVLSHVVEDARPVLEQMAASAGRTLTIDAADTRGTLDRTATSRALQTVVANAVAAAQTSVAVRVCPDGSIEIADDGPGVTPSDQDRMFEAFFTTRAEGTGLGLAMAQRLMAAQGGGVEYRHGRGLGPKGSGASFVLTFAQEKTA